MVRVTVTPELIHWALDRSGKDVLALAKPFPKLKEWEAGEIQPTLKQLERFAKATYTPLGYLFLSEPPEEQVPIPDFRTMAGREIARSSPDLLETIYICQQRQEWYRDYAQSMGMEELPFIGSFSVTDDVVETAAVIRAAIGFDIDERRHARTWAEALRLFIEQADALGILVMTSGVVGSNTRRNLNPEEFRGFALADSLAPLVFINGADTKSAQMFTLAHELAHIWLGQSAVSDTQAVQITEHETERWCNETAAEILVPLHLFADEYKRSTELRVEVDRLARVFKVSTLVILRRIHDVGGLSRDEFWEEYSLELKRLMALPKSSGGDFYRTQPARVSKRFARAIMISTLEGQTLHRDAFRMLGLRKLSTFHELGRKLEVM